MSEQDASERLAGPTARTAASVDQVSTEPPANARANGDLPRNGAIPRGGALPRGGDIPREGDLPAISRRPIDGDVASLSHRADGDHHDAARSASDEGSNEERGEDSYSISELSAAFDVTPRAIRFYESKGLIAPQRQGTARLYSRRDRARLQMILRGKNLGFTLEEIREYLDLYDADPSLSVQTRHLLGKVEGAISDLALKRADLDRTLAELEQIRSECVAHLRGVEKER